ncbi:unnamed protein product [Absidia cylindrospora]
MTDANAADDSFDIELTDANYNEAPSAEYSINTPFVDEEVVVTPRRYLKKDFPDATPDGHQFNLEIYEIINKYNAPRRLYEELEVAINLKFKSYGVTDPPLKSTFINKKVLNGATATTFTSYGSCMVYLDRGNQEKTKCDHYDMPRYKLGVSKKETALVSYASISDIMAMMLHTKGTSKQLMYRAERRSPYGSMEDVFDGGLYQIMQNQGFFDSKYDIAIGLSIDGFQAFNRSQKKENWIT